MDQTIRNKLRGVVTQCRKLLEDSTAQALQGRFGIYPSRKKGEVQIEDEARMAHLTEEDRACRQDLLDHLEHIQAIGYKPSEALEQLVREISFTHLNRLCAYKMMESRGLIREAVSRGLKSQGFFFYLSDHPEDEKLHNGGGQETAYRNFLDWLGGTLSQEIGVLFNPNDPANRIYPPQRVMDEVLALINDGELKDIWSQDETIGWVYQYFTPKELRDKARKESQAPRNSYELAFRNQFFTPRYVVEFLTDNTLGRIWYEMRKGKTILKDRCKYLVRRPTEIFLKDGELPPAESNEAREDLSQEELLKQPVYIHHRPEKDPRELKVLDPACGSGHFLLYCFDLIQIIYEEAWIEESAVGGRQSAVVATNSDSSHTAYCPLSTSYSSLEDLRRAVPGLILKHNLHGIDIDLRATQIAALALWLRCQRAYQELGLKNGERPKITRSNIVCAEPMPGETDLLKEFASTLQPKVLGQLVETVFERMKLAGEAGSLLKIEEEIRETASTAKKEYQEELRLRKEQAGYLPGMAPPRERTIFDFSDMTDSEFLDRAEDEIVAALRQYAETASNGRGFRRRLFAEDAARGFSFVDVSSKKYDVVLMNPPFGKIIPGTECKSYLEKAYPGNWTDYFNAFLIKSRGFGEDHSFVGAVIPDRILNAKKSSSVRELFVNNWCPLTMIDCGCEVMDEAAVDALLLVTPNGDCSTHRLTYFLDLKSIDVTLRSTSLRDWCASPNGIRDLRLFGHIPGVPFAFNKPNSIIRLWTHENRLDPDLATVATGGKTFDDTRFLRLRWEVPPPSLETDWISVDTGGDYQPWLSPSLFVQDWRQDGREMRQFAVERHGTDAQVMQSSKFWFKPGLSYPLTSSIGFGPRVFPAGTILSADSIAVAPNAGIDGLALLGILASSWSGELLTVFGEYRRSENSSVKSLPISISPQQVNTIRQFTEDAIQLVLSLERMSETSPYFSAPFEMGAVKEIKESLEDLMSNLDRTCKENYQIPAEYVPSVCHGAIVKAFVAEPSQKEIHFSSLSYFVGVTLGRWNVRCLDNAKALPRASLAFERLPICPPGMLQGPDGLPAKPEDVPSDYPIRIDWDGILVDDPGHEDDIIRRVQNVLEVIWKDRAEAIEKEACETLGVRELRDYFRKPGNGGFWMDHVKRYSKSRRKAPIYWYLRSAKGNYGLWLYYHRLDKDILFKALLNYVEPKIRLEEDRLRTLRGRKEAAGSSGREAKQLEKDIDRQEQFVSELRDFEEKLRRVANLHLDFDLNDGVILNIAPLGELVPWNESKKYWEALQEGKYDWSHVAYQLWPERVQESCKKNRSIAIAHGLEEFSDMQTLGQKRSAGGSESPRRAQKGTRGRIRQ